MKSIKQEPISHPTWQMIQSKLDKTHEDLHLVSFCIDMLSWGKNSNMGTMKVSIPVSSHMDTAWQVITYELTSVKDYEELSSKYEQLRQKVREMSKKES